MVEFAGEIPRQYDEDPKEKGKKPPLPPEIEHGFTLIIGNDDHSIDNADVRVRWCVTPELTKHLIDEGVVNPHVLIATFNNQGRNEWRGLYPLEQVIAFARCYNAGEIDIVAMIVDMPQNHETFRSRKNFFFNKDDIDHFEYRIQEGGTTKGLADGKRIRAVTQECMLIPDNVFGREPTGWIKWFANLWHNQRQKIDDQCEFRRRLAIAFAVKWIPMALWTMFHFIMLVGLNGLLYLAGLYSWFKDLSWKQIGRQCNPFGSDMFVLFSSGSEHENLRDSAYVIHKTWKDVDGVDVQQPFWTLFLFSPGVILLLAGIVWLSVHDHMFPWYEVHWYTAHIAFYGAVILALLDLTNTILHYVVLNVWQAKEYDIRAGKMYIFSCFTLLATTLVVLLTFFVPWSLVGIGISLFSAAIIAWWFRRPSAVSTTNKIGQFLDKFLDMILGLFDTRDDYTEMRELLCPQDLKNLSTRLDSLPARNRSWYLIYRNAKAKMCRPMQR